MPLVKFLVRHALFFYVACSLLVVSLMGLATGVIDEYELVKKGVNTLGVIVEPTCEWHLSFSYRFEVAGATYSGLSVSDNCSSVRAGAVVAVHYLPADPSVNTAADPAHLFANNRDTILMVGLTAPAFLLLILNVQLKIWAKRNWV